MRFDDAVVIGKFYPPHRGHKFLIDTALAQATTVHVILCAKPDESPDGELRTQWLREIHPQAQVMVIDDRYDENDTSVWAANTINWLGRAPQAVFTSENYGDAYAKAMGSIHVSVDRARTTVPCAGRSIRADPFANWSFLEPPVKAWYARRICVLGAESTGTTTLAQALARHYDTPWVPEYGREYSNKKMEQGETDWNSDEFVHIANQQSRREDEAARCCNRVVIGDTNAFATCLWHRRYMGTDHEAVTAATAGSRCHLYLLTGDEIPFVQDGLRDGEHIRHEMHQWFMKALTSQNVPWHLLRGSHESRLHEAVALIDRYFFSYPR